MKSFVAALIFILSIGTANAGGFFSTVFGDNSYCGSLEDDLAARFTQLAQPFDSKIGVQKVTSKAIDVGVCHLTFKLNDGTSISGLMEPHNDENIYYWLPDFERITSNQLTPLEKKIVASQDEKNRVRDEKAAAKQKELVSYPFPIPLEPRGKILGVSLENASENIGVVKNSGFTCDSISMVVVGNAFEVGGTDVFCNSLRYKYSVGMKNGQVFVVPRQ